jgi:hypothetical protein
MVSPFNSNQRQVMEKVQGLQANVTKTLLELKTNATAKLKALKDNVDRRMAQSLVVSLALFNANGGASSMGMTVSSADGSMSGSATDSSSIGVDKNAGSNVSRGGSNDGDSGAGGGGLGKTTGSILSGEGNRKGSNDGDSEAGGGLGKTTGIMISGEGNRKGSNDGDSGAGGGSLGKTTGSAVSGEGNRNGDSGSGGNSNNDGRTGGNASSRATGDAGAAGQTTPPREFINGDIKRSDEAISNLAANSANSSTGDENPSRNLAGTSQNSSKNGNQTSTDYKVMPLQDQREGSGLQRPKRFRRQVPATVKTERPSASRGEESLVSPKETLRSSLVLPTDDLVSVPTPAVMRAAAVQPEAGADVAGGLKANLADLEFLLQSYRIDAEEMLINRHLLTATSDMNAFFMQIDNIAKGKKTSFYVVQ